MLYSTKNGIRGSKYALLHCHFDKRCKTGTESIDTKRWEGLPYQILLKLDRIPENKVWIYDHIIDTYGASRGMIAGIAKRFVMEGMEEDIGRKIHKNRYHKITGDVKDRIYAIVRSEPSGGTSRWFMRLLRMN